MENNSILKQLENKNESLYLALEQAMQQYEQIILMCQVYQQLEICSPIKSVTPYLLSQLLENRTYLTKRLLNRQMISQQSQEFYLMLKMYQDNFDNLRLALIMKEGLIFNKLSIKVNALESQYHKHTPKIQRLAQMGRNQWRKGSIEVALRKYAKYRKAHSVREEMNRKANSGREEMNRKAHSGREEEMKENKVMLPTFRIQFLSKRDQQFFNDLNTMIEEENEKNRRLTEEYAHYLPILKIVEKENIELKEQILMQQKIGKESVLKQWDHFLENNL